MTASVFHHCHTRALQHAAHTSMHARIPTYTHAGIFAAPRTSILMKTDLSSLKCLSSKTGLGFRRKTSNFLELVVRQTFLSTHGWNHSVTLM